MTLAYYSLSVKSFDSYVSPQLDVGNRIRSNQNLNTSLDSNVASHNWRRLYTDQWPLLLTWFNFNPSMDK